MQLVFNVLADLTAVVSQTLTPSIILGNYPLNDDRYVFNMGMYKALQLKFGSVSSHLMETIYTEYRENGTPFQYPKAKANMLMAFYKPGDVEKTIYSHDFVVSGKNMWEQDIKIPYDLISSPSADLYYHYKHLNQDFYSWFDANDNFISNGNNPVLGGYIKFRKVYRKRQIKTTIAATSPALKVNYEMLEENQYSNQYVKYKDLDLLNIKKLSDRLSFSNVVNTDSDGGNLRNADMIAAQSTDFHKDGRFNIVNELYPGGIRGKAVKFVGGLGGGALRSNIPFDPFTGNQMAVSFWFAAHQQRSPSQKIIIHQGSNNLSNGFRFSFDSSTNPPSIYFYITLGVAIVYPLHDFSYGRFYHIVGTVEGNVAKLYIDGKLETYYITLSSTFQHTSNFLLVGGNAAVETDFVGLVDDLIIFDRTLPITDGDPEKASVSTLYGNGKPPYIGYDSYFWQHQNIKFFYNFDKMETPDTSPKFLSYAIGSTTDHSLLLLNCSRPDLALDVGRVPAVEWATLFNREVVVFHSGSGYSGGIEATRDDLLLFKKMFSYQAVPGDYVNYPRVPIDKLVSQNTGTVNYNLPLICKKDSRGEIVPDHAYAEWLTGQLSDSEVWNYRPELDQAGTRVLSNPRRTDLVPVLDVFNEYIRYRDIDLAGNGGTLGENFQVLASVYKNRHLIYGKVINKGSAQARYSVILR